MATIPRLEARHRPSGLNSGFRCGRLAFTDYVAHSREMIAQARVETDAALLQKIVDGNAPFELHPAAGFRGGLHQPCRRGVLLTHGLTDSPYFMRHLAGIFRQHGFRVMAPLLPGHGTRPGDLLEVGWQEWARAVAYGVEQLAGEVDEIYLAGFSAGAALSLHHSLHDRRVRGLFLFSPALAISSWAALARLHKLYSWLVPSARWLDIMPDRDRYKYESFPKNAAAQMHALIRQLALPGSGTEIPVFAAASRDDSTVDSTATLAFMARAHHPCSRLVLYTTDTQQVPAGIPAEKLELVNSTVPARRILSSAHTAIVLPPDDPYYGVAGEYANCLHYYPHDMGQYAACNDSAQAVWLGEITATNLKAGTLRRLMYNPHFAALELSIARFIDSLP